MEVRLSPDQKAFVQQAIESGRLSREEEAVQEALSLWEERERLRAEILAAVDAADDSLARGDGRVITQESMQQLAEDVKQRGRARMASHVIFRRPERCDNEIPLRSDLWAELFSACSVHVRPSASPRSHAPASTRNHFVEAEPSGWRDSFPQVQAHKPR
jgi:antitoxin ParD1/3/4